MTVPFMDAYVRLLIKTCHRRGVHAMGGMAAQIPIKNDTAANNAAMAKVGAMCGTRGASTYSNCRYKHLLLWHIMKCNNNDNNNKPPSWVQVCSWDRS